MADNTTRTPGSGETIAADEISSVKYQRVKVTLGPDGTNNGDLDGTTTRGARVDPFGSTTRVQVTPTIDTGAYSATDQFGGIMPIPAAARFTGGGGRLLAVTMMINTSLAPTVDLYFFDRSVSLAANNANATFSDADMAFFLGAVQITASSYVTAITSPSNRVAQVPQFTQAAAVGWSLPYVCAATTLYCAAVIQSATTFATTTATLFSFTFAPD